MGKILIIGGADYSKVALDQVTPITGKISINVVASPSGGGVVSGSGSYNEGDSITISAVANDGFEFVGWDDGNTNPSRTIVVGSSSKTYIASFKGYKWNNLLKIPENTGHVNGGSGNTPTYQESGYYHTSIIPTVGMSKIIVRDWGTLAVTYAKRTTEDGAWAQVRDPNAFVAVGDYLEMMVPNDANAIILHYNDTNPLKTCGEFPNGSPAYRLE